MDGCNFCGEKATHYFKIGLNPSHEFCDTHHDEFVKIWEEKKK